MSNRRIGVWLVGALGSIATTVILGALSFRKGTKETTGMITETGSFKELGLVSLDRLEFGGCDLRKGRLRDAARHVVRETGALSSEFLEEIDEDLMAIERDIQMGTVRNCGEAIRKLSVSTLFDEGSIRQEVAAICGQFRSFKERKSLDELVVVNLASTEPPLPIQEVHHDLGAFEAALDRNDLDVVRASTIYAYAAVQEGCPYINFTPSNGALIPAVVEMAERNGVPVMGNDGKTGETLVKSALAPMFLCRNLQVLSWEGFNILGNMDGCVLDHPENRESKIKSKDQVLSKILGYTPHSRVHIHYVPSLDDQKTAWDYIHFKGFLGTKMSLQFVWQGYDSLLAAPLVLDLVRLAELAKRRGESGLMPHLASYFKAPMGVEEYRLNEQFEMLLNYARKAGGGDDRVA
ncbi:inositol-3-phosphate synthase [Desulforhabdus amnigena]|jgi:myo-inositol-1-phosphate synthase|uniref:Myo-inositol-1-phosphate synthase n=1 Tax=Desulforhabdus amnigena TaxID=40218 RepID=A0A9W6FWV7_9BACT|nr:inositol-3-phosphate synthase [Desulforhabdus amnigena]NLJ28573.1 myo-inositol-1-phosphate synthase [Deltaproteobacteria bacterium]GLI36324.1 myo-inositol-1-phosphate synthase [Desulforhabdus amnigena]